MGETELIVSAICNGTVIDRIPTTELFKVIEILGLSKLDHTMTFGTNLRSSKLGRKAIIKISDYFFEDEDINRIALVAPDAQLNIIKDYKVVEKRSLKVPGKVSGIIRCFNPRCITNHQMVESRFTTVYKDGEMAFKCDYCEKITTKKNMFIIGKSK